VLWFVELQIRCGRKV